MRLFHTATNQPVEKGDIVTDFRGEEAMVTNWRKPENQWSTGRIYVVNPDGSGFEGEFYPSVFGCEWREG